MWTSQVYGHHNKMARTKTKPRLQAMLPDVFRVYQFNYTHYNISGVKRATCAIGDAVGVGDLGCEAHCWALNRQGGHCNSQNVCVCRSETIFK